MFCLWYHASVKACFLLLLTIPLLLSCAQSLTVKGYVGEDLPKTELALIESGPWTKIERLDDRRLGTREFNVLVLPGEHTIEASLLQTEIGNLIIYTHLKAVLKFQAEKGKRYFVYAHIHPSEWVLRVVEKGSNKEVAASAPLPLKVEMILFGGYGGPDTWTTGQGNK